MKKNKDTTPMMQQYFAIKNAHKDYLLFYRMGDFYEMFFDDAVKASVALDITLTKRGKDNGEDIPMCGVPVASHEMYLSRLVKKGFKVAIAEQMEDPAEAKKRGSSACVKRDVVRIITPGTITEDSILDMRRNNYLLALADNESGVGLAWTDVSTGDLWVEEAAFPYLLAEIARLEPEEIVLSERLEQRDEFKQAFQAMRERLTILPTVRFSSENAKERVENTFKLKTMEAFGDFSRIEMTAIGVLIDYIELTQKGQMPRLLPPKKLIDGAIMEIDLSTRRSLEIFSSLSGEKNALTLLSAIDKTVTGGGARLLSQQLASPLTNDKDINDRLDMVDFFFVNELVRDKVRDTFKGSSDMERALSRLALGRAGPRDMMAIIDVLDKVPHISSLFFEKRALIPESLKSVLDLLGNHTALVQELKKAFKPDLPLLVRDGDFIAKGFSPTLDELHSIRDDSKKFIASLQSKYATQSGVSSLKITYNNLLGYYIEVSAKYGQSLIDASKNGEINFIHRQTMANAVRFSTVELANLEEKIRGAAEKAVALEITIFEELARKVLADAEKITNTAKALAIIDVASSLALIARERNYVRPLVDKSLDFSIVKGRHPVVEEALRRSHTGEFIPNDCDMLGTKSGRVNALGDFRSDAQNASSTEIWLLTGPNMAGKSTFLRQNALIAIMAQMGSFVPAEYAKIGVVDKLFSRVGASDDLAKGQSTFMVEMVETATILNRATERSFVILDEIGRGTATFDGLSIAWAVMEHLHEKNKCRALFATHYHELTTLADKLKNLSLHTMKIKEWKGDVVFLHEVGEGSADRSYGIHVAKLAGLPPSVIARAKQVLEGLENKKIKAEKVCETLPLFSVLEKQVEKKISPLQKEIEKINPDEFSPKEALELLYKLSKIAKDNKAED